MCFVTCYWCSSKETYVLVPMIRVVYSARVPSSRYIILLGRVHRTNHTQPRPLAFYRVTQRTPSEPPNTEQVWLFPSTKDLPLTGD